MTPKSERIIPKSERVFMKSERLSSGVPSNNGYRAPNINNKEDIDFESRGVLQCLIRGISGSGTLSKISIKKICNGCSYTDNEGNYHSYGKDRLNTVLTKLESAGKIIINHPVRGGCTTYTIRGLNNFEPVPDAIYYLQFSPEQKGFILFMMEHNVNKYRKAHDLNYDPEIAECDWNDSEINKFSHLPINKLRKIEESLIPSGAYSIVETTKRDSETGLPILSRRLDLKKLGLIGITLQNNTTVNKQVDELYDYIEENCVSKEDLIRILREEGSKQSD